MRSKEETIEHFRYIPPNDETRPRHERVTDIFVNAVEILWDVTPDGPGKTYAFRKLGEAKMAFNSAIAHEGG